MTAADLAKMPRLAVDVREPHTAEMQHYEGVRLSDLLLKAGVPLGQNLRGQALGTCVVARASDGYAVVYSLAELDPAMTDNQIIVADKMNGKALAPKQGPFRVVVPGDKRRALGQDGQRVRGYQPAQSFKIITSVAFTTADTESPFFSFSSAALRRVITLSIRLPPHSNHHVSHDVSEDNLFDLATQFVSR